MARLEAKLALRNKALAAAGVAHLKPLLVYTTELFDKAFEKPVSKNFRAPNPAELIAVDRQAWEEIIRLVEDKKGDVDSCLIHVSKAGGLLGTLLRPVPCELKQGQVKVACSVFCQFLRLLFVYRLPGDQSKR